MFGVGSSLFLRISAEFGPLVHDIQTQINNSSAKVVVPREYDTAIQVIALHLAGLSGLPGTYPRLYQSRYKDSKVSQLHERLTAADLKHFKFFTGGQFVHWVIDREYAPTISEAVLLGTRLLEAGYIGSTVASSSRFFSHSSAEYFLCQPFEPAHLINLEDSSEEAKRLKLSTTDLYALASNISHATANEITFVPRPPPSLIQVYETQFKTAVSPARTPKSMSMSISQDSDRDCFSGYDLIHFILRKKLNCPVRLLVASPFFRHTTYSHTLTTSADVDPDVLNPSPLTEEDYVKLSQLIRDAIAIAMHLIKHDLLTHVSSPTDIPDNTYTQPRDVIDAAYCGQYTSATNNIYNVYPDPYFSTQHGAHTHAHTRLRSGSTAVTPRASSRAAAYAQSMHTAMGAQSSSGPDDAVVTVYPSFPVEFSLSEVLYRITVADAQQDEAMDIETVVLADMGIIGVGMGMGMGMGEYVDNMPLPMPRNSVSFKQDASFSSPLLLPSDAPRPSDVQRFPEPVAPSPSIGPAHVRTRASSHAGTGGVATGAGHSPALAHIDEETRGNSSGKTPSPIFPGFSGGGIISTGVSSPLMLPSLTSTLSQGVDDTYLHLANTGHHSANTGASTGPEAVNGASSASTASTGSGGSSLSPLSLPTPAPAPGASPELSPQPPARHTSELASPLVSALTVPLGLSTMPSNHSSGTTNGSGAAGMFGAPGLSPVPLAHAASASYSADDNTAAFMLSPGLTPFSIPALGLSNPELSGPSPLSSLAGRPAAVSVSSVGDAPAPATLSRIPTVNPTLSSSTSMVHSVSFADTTTHSATLSALSAHILARTGCSIPSLVLASHNIANLGLVPAHTHNTPLPRASVSNGTGASPVSKPATPKTTPAPALVPATVEVLNVPLSAASQPLPTAAMMAHNQKKRMARALPDVMVDTISGVNSVLEWEFVESFGEDSVDSYSQSDGTYGSAEVNITDDQVTAVEFSSTGEFLAIADRAGRVSIVQEMNTHRYDQYGNVVDLYDRVDVDTTVDNTSTPYQAPLEYRFYTEFTSFTTDLDLLKNTVIEPKINVVRWLPQLPSHRNISLLAANDKVVKLWRLTELYGSPSPETFLPKRIGYGEFVAMRNEDPNYQYNRYYNNHDYGIKRVSVPSKAARSLNSKTGVMTTHTSDVPLSSRVIDGAPYYQTYGLLPSICTPYTPPTGLYGITSQHLSSIPSHPSLLSSPSFGPLSPSALSSTSTGASAGINYRYKHRNPMVRSYALSHGVMGLTGTALPQDTLPVPCSDSLQPTVRSSLCQEYKTGHDYCIHSLSLCSDQLTFLSADDTRVNMWSLEDSYYGYTLYEHALSENGEDAQDYITAATYHPTRCNLFALGWSNGIVTMMDLRAHAPSEGNNALSTSVFDPRLYEGSNPYRNPELPIHAIDYISGIMDVKFSQDGIYMTTRDFLSCRVWDTRHTAKPVQEYRVNQYAVKDIEELCENSAIFDAHQVAISPNARHIITGTYYNTFCLINTDLPSTTTGVAPSHTVDSLLNAKLGERGTGAIAAANAAAAGTATGSTAAEKDAGAPPSSTDVSGGVSPLFPPLSPAVLSSTTNNAAASTGEGRGNTDGHASVGTTSPNVTATADTTIAPTSPAHSSLSTNSIPLSDTLTTSAGAGTTGSSTTAPSLAGRRGSMMTSTPLNAGNACVCTYVHARDDMREVERVAEAKPEFNTLSPQLEQALNTTVDSLLAGTCTYPLPTSHRRRARKRKLGSPREHFSKKEGYQDRMLKLSWHPRNNVVAVAGTYKLFLYQGRPAVSRGGVLATGPTTAMSQSAYIGSAGFNTPGMTGMGTGVGLGVGGSVPSPTNATTTTTTGAVDAGSSTGYTTTPARPINVSVQVSTPSPKPALTASSPSSTTSPSPLPLSPSLSPSHAPGLKSPTPGSTSASGLSGSPVSGKAPARARSVSNPPISSPTASAAAAAAGSPGASAGTGSAAVTSPVLLPRTPSRTYVSTASLTSPTSSSLSHSHSDPSPVLLSSPSLSYSSPPSTSLSSFTSPSLSYSPSSPSPSPSPATAPAPKLLPSPSPTPATSSSLSLSLSPPASLSISLSPGSPLSPQQVVPVPLLPLSPSRYTSLSSPTPTDPAQAPHPPHHSLPHTPTTPSKASSTVSSTLLTSPPHLPLPPPTRRTTPAAKKSKDRDTDHTPFNPASSPSSPSSLSSAGSSPASTASPSALSHKLAMQMSPSSLSSVSSPPLTAASPGARSSASTTAARSPSPATNMPKKTVTRRDSAENKVDSP